MASDLTATKNLLYVQATRGDVTQLLPCPTCPNMMAVDELHARYAIGTGQVAWNAVEVAQASHTVPATMGGKHVALECATCNHRRGDDVWHTTAPVARVGKTAAAREATGIVRASRERLAG